MTWSDVAVAGAFVLGIIAGGIATLHLVRSVIRIRDKQE